MNTEVPKASQNPEQLFNTSQLAVFRQVIEQNPALSLQLGVIAKFRLVVDTNAVLDDLFYRCKNPSRGALALEELIASSVLEVWAPRWLAFEVEKYLVPLAIEKGMQPELVQLEWIRFQALLIWDETEREPAEQQGVRDYKDLPFLRVAEKIGAIGILTKDRDIAAMGGTRVSREFISGTRGYARATTVALSIRILGVGVTHVSAALLVSLTQLVTRTFRRLPVPLQLLFLAGVVIALVHPESRRWIRTQLASAQVQLSPLGQTLFKFMQEAKQVADDHQVKADQRLQGSLALLPQRPRPVVIRVRPLRRTFRKTRVKPSSP